MSSFDWLRKEPAPRMLLEAMKLLGIKETSGARNTPAIMAWAHELGGDVAKVYTQDATPWCGLFLAIIAKRAGKPLPVSPLWARAWASWGEKSPRAALGDVLVFVRDGGGHVALYVGEDSTAYYCLGGNQSDAVSIKRIAKDRCIAVRRFYAIGVPPNVRTIRVNSSGEPLSVNEA